MYIRKQPSGGRGEYEISGDYDDGISVFRAGDLADRQLHIEFGSYGYHATANVLRQISGKKRIRLLDQHRDIHAARQVTAALLLPKSRREEIGLGGGRPTVMHERYIVRQMHFDTLSLQGNTDALIRLGNLDLDNGSQVDTVAFSPRMRLVEHLHQKADKFPDAIKKPLEQHQVMLQATAPLGTEAEALVDLLMNHVAENAPDYNVEFTKGGDVVPVLIEMVDSPPIDEPVDIESIPPEDIDIRLREAARWRRWAAARGPASARFRRAVRDAYNSTCMVCGIRLPVSDFCRVPGVDSAHILPWSTHDLEVVSNGICLCKLHHWAFDQQLMVIKFENDEYRVSVTQRAADALDSHAVEQLRAYQGVVVQRRLPTDKALWPRPEFLIKLYEMLGDPT
jgi:putative restriction endonuclease